MISSLVALVLACGTEDWDEKTLMDAEPFMRATNWTLTVKDLRAAQNTNPGIHLAETVDAYVLGFKLETDEDIHVVIADSPTGPTMIAELPADECAKGSPHAVEMAQARKDFVAIFGEPHTKFKRIKPVKVRLEGVVYFDHIHGQTGVAPNGVELHPLLGVHLLQSTRNPPSTGE